MADVLRTSDERFNELPDFAFAPHYLDDLKGFGSIWPLEASLWPCNH